MKTLTILSYLILLTCCAKLQENVKDKIVIFGKIDNPDIIIPRIDFYLCRLGLFPAEKMSFNLDDEGRFKIEFKSKVPIDLSLQYNSGFRFIAHPGDSIYLQFDGSKKDRVETLNTVTFKGSSAQENRDIAEFQKMLFKDGISLNCILKINRAQKRLGEEDFKLFMDSLHSELILLHEEFVKKTKPSVEVSKWSKAYIDLDYYTNLLMYPQIHRPDDVDRSVWQASNEYYSFLNHIPSLDSISNINSFSKMSFINWYSGNIRSELLYRDNKTFFDSKDSVKNIRDLLDSIQLFGIIKYTPDNILRQFALSEHLSQNLYLFQVKTYEKYKNQIDTIITEKYLAEQLRQQYDSTIYKIANTRNLNNQMILKIKSSSTQKEVDSLFSNFKGKIVYIDCWATWCGPCLAELPNSFKLIEKYHNKDVEFLFVCLDSEEKIWRAKISDFPAMCKHVFLNKIQSQDFRDIFKITGIPHYILIDKNGEIVENNTDPPFSISSKIDDLI